jgi:hypothetical protein
MHLWFPLLPLALVVAYTWPTWRIAIHQRIAEDPEGENQRWHNDRIYKDFEFFLQVSILLLSAMGYVRLDKYRADPGAARQAMMILGGLELLSMTLLAIFVASHQASKFQRWRHVDARRWWSWQEVWMMVGMCVVGSSAWVIACLW